MSCSAPSPSHAPTAPAASPSSRVNTASKRSRGPPTRRPPSPETMPPGLVASTPTSTWTLSTMPFCRSRARPTPPIDPSTARPSLPNRHLPATNPTRARIDTSSCTARLPSRSRCSGCASETRRESCKVRTSSTSSSTSSRPASKSQTASSGTSGTFTVHTCSAPLRRRARRVPPSRALTTISVICPWSRRP